MKKFKTIFWDFDGVIKESVSIKSDAFEQLFNPFGPEIAKKVRAHHEANGGLSRYEKIELYLSWIGEEINSKVTEDYAYKFSCIVKDKVINSEWVPGVLNYLEDNHHDQQFFLVTATPQEEINFILSSLNIKHFFKGIAGSPTKKNDAIMNYIEKYSIISDQALVIGDSETDYNAAIKNNVHFVLRKTNHNINLQNNLSCEIIVDFTNCK